MPDITAAVIRDNSGTFTLEDLVLDEPRPGEVLVKVVGAGLCHTDIFFAQVGAPPAVLGHEGSGIVEAVGDGVLGFAVGDRVLMSFNSCGSCLKCLTGKPAYCDNFLLLNVAGIRPDGSKTIVDSAGAPVSGSFFGQSSFANYALANPRNLVKVPDNVSDELFTILGPLGCGVQTGAGAAMNSLDVEPGSSLIVTGGGSVGLSALLGALVNGATTVVVIDIKPERLELARELGATHTINGLDADVPEQLAAILGAGADYAIDTTGNPRVIRTAFEGLSPSGSMALIAATAPGAEFTTDFTNFQNGRKVKGIIEGDSVPQDFIPRLIALHQAGRFPFDKLVKLYPFASIQDAVEDSEHGGTLKAVLTF